jgi:hypothetical protein
MWYSKRQNTVESSTFVSEFVVMRVAIEMIEGLRYYKLRSHDGYSHRWSDECFL